MVTIAQRMYIDGRWRDAEGDSVFGVLDPATRRMIERVPDASAADVRSAVDAADPAFPAWAATPAKERGRILARIQAPVESETEAIARACHDAGLPPGVFNVVTTRRPSVAATEIGQWIMERAAAQLKRLSFELGGNAPFIVFDDADVEAAVAAAVAIKFLRVAGQSCIRANRIYVQTGIAARFVPAFTEAVKRLRVAPGFEAGPEVGRLINEETRRKVHGLAEDAVGGGARALTGGRP